MISWKFKPIAEDDTRENPLQSQFFTTDEVGSIANGLIREGIQNALDERLDRTKPVRIKITINNGINKLQPTVYNKYTMGLSEHLYSKESGLRNLPSLSSDDMPFLVFEDFNTKGLRGNPIESRDVEIEDSSKPHNFYYFWRNIGITGKSEDKLGRWGVGKTVFPALSRINMFWGYTVQSDTKAELLLGQSILKKHNIESDPKDWGYKPYGYFGMFDSGSYFAKPIADQSFLHQFKQDFKISRNNEPGLSVVIPFFNSEVTKTRLILGIIKQYFFPLINGSLEVVIKNEDTEITIEKGNLGDILSNILKDFYDDQIDSQEFQLEQIKALFDFTQWSINLKDGDYIVLSQPPIDNQPKWEERLWQGIDLDKLIEQYDTNKRIAFKVPVKYHNRDRDEPARICWFKLFLENDDTLKKPEDHFIRENITIIDVKSLDAPNTRGIVLIDDKDLANLLGDSENPAHTQWQKDSQNFTYKYTHGDKCISFIVNSLQRVYSKLQRPAEGLNKDILQDLFYIENQEDNHPNKPDDDSKKDEKSESETFEIKGSKPRVRVTKIRGGISIKSAREPNENLASISLQLAYMTTRGKPLKKYQPFDFELNKKPIEIYKKGCLITHNKKNEVRFNITDPNFEITINGFDVNRDLFVKLNTEITDDQEI